MIIKKDKIVQFGISQKSDGQMRIGESNLALENRRMYFSKQNIDFSRTVSAGLEHGSTVSIVDENHLGKVIPNSDALVTDRMHVYLTITVSDCVPIFFYDKKGVIGIAHAGWKGVASNITAKTVEAMCKEFGSSPKDIEIYIGPHIKKCHFEVQQEVASQFESYPYSVERRDGKVFISLEEIIKNQLHNASVPSDNVEIGSDCTYCSDKYFSFRKDNLSKVTSQVAYIALI